MEWPVWGCAGRMTRRIMAWIKRLFALLAISCLLYFGWHTRDLFGYYFQCLPGIAGSSCWHVVAHAFMSPLFAAVVFRGSGSNMSYQCALRIHLANLPARYIPGGIWHTVGRIVAFRELGFDANRISLFVLLENLLAAAVAFLLGGGLLSLYRGLDDWGSLAVLCAAAGALVLLALPILLRFWLAGT